MILERKMKIQENTRDRQTDYMWSEKLLWAFSVHVGELEHELFELMNLKGVSKIVIFLTNHCIDKTGPPPFPRTKNYNCLCLIKIILFHSIETTAVAQSFRALASLAEGRVFKSVKQVVTVPLPNARQQVGVWRFLWNDHYKRIPRVTVGNLTAQWSWVPSISQSLKPFTDNSDVSIWMKKSRMGR